MSLLEIRQRLADKLGVPVEQVRYDPLDGGDGTHAPLGHLLVPPDASLVGDSSIALGQLLSHDHPGFGFPGPAPLTQRSTMELDTQAKARLVEPEEGLRELPASLASYEDGLGRLATIVDRLENRIARTLRPASDDDSVMASTGAVTDMGSRIGEYNMTLERIILRLADLEHRCQL